jgi:hypothetical protein
MKKKGMTILPRSIKGGEQKYREEGTSKLSGENHHYNYYHVYSNNTYFGSGLEWHGISNLIKLNAIR